MHIEAFQWDCNRSHEKQTQENVSGGFSLCVIDVLVQRKPTEQRRAWDLCRPLCVCVCLCAAVYYCACPGHKRFKIKYTARQQGQGLFFFCSDKILFLGRILFVFTDSASTIMLIVDWREKLIFQVRSVSCLSHTVPAMWL